MILGWAKSRGTAAWPGCGTKLREGGVRMKGRVVLCAYVCGSVAALLLPGVVRADIGIQGPAYTTGTVITIDGGMCNAGALM